VSAGGEMKTLRIPVLWLTLLALSTALPASGGQRQGFIFGAGFGAGYVTDTSSYSAEDWGWHSFGLAANIKAGYGLSNSLELYLFGSGWINSDQAWDVIGVTGAGVTKYLDRNGSGFSVSGGLGISFFNFERDVLRPRLGFLLGAGYDLSKHLSLQGDILFARISGDSGLTHDSENAWGFRVTLNYLVF
jgi:hypothetical protein